MQGWTKLGAHARLSTSISKTTTVFFSSRYGFSVFTFVFAVSDSYPRRSSLFFESVATTQATMMLAYRSWGFLPLSLVVPCPTPWKSTTTVYLAVYGCCKQQIFVTVGYACTSLDHGLRTTWSGFHECLHTIKSCLPLVYPWRHACDKMYQALPLLNGESLETRLSRSYFFNTAVKHTRLGD